MQKKIVNTKAAQIVLILSLILNLTLGFLLFKATIHTTNAEEASGIKNFKYGVDCNTVFSYKVCTSDFIGLPERDATYKARTHGLHPVVSARDSKPLAGYIDNEPFRINFEIKKEVVTGASFH